MFGLFASAPGTAASSGTQGAPVGGQAMPFPIDDWQFWVVTVVAFAAAAWLVWRLAPHRLFRAKRRGSKPATLTVGGRPVGGRGRGEDRCH